MEQEIMTFALLAISITLIFVCYHGIKDIKKLDKMLTELEIKYDSD